MEPISFNINIHGTPTACRRHDYFDAPVSIEFGGMSREVTIFCPDAMAADLVTAIRDVLAKYPAEVAEVYAEPVLEGLPF